MRNGSTHPAVVASPAARLAIGALRHTCGPVTFGCSGGTAPTCYSAGRQHIDERDLLLGEVDGCPFYIDAALYEGWHGPRLVLDVEPGAADGGSLPAGPGKHFVVWSPHPGELNRLAAG
jgi:uncharacterized protein (DUF779 family)